MDMLVVFAMAALLVRVGQALYATGLARSKNAAGAVLRSVTDLCVTVLCVWAIGAAVFSGDSSFLFGRTMPAGSGLLSLTVVVLIGTGIVAPVLAERTRFAPLCVISVILATVLVPLLLKWGSAGWLFEKLGYIDAGGAGAVHVVCGTVGAVGAIFVGARTGKYNRDGSSNAIPGHSVVLASTGVLIKFVGWLPYLVAASILLRDEPAGLGRTAMNALLAAAAGGLTSLAVGRIRYGKPEVFLTYSGLLGGLVAVSAGGGEISTLAAVIIGLVAGLVVPIATLLFDLLWKIDDPSGYVAIHLVGGAWGILATGLFSPAGFAAKFKQLGSQAIGLLVILAIAAVVAVGVFALLRATIGLRSKEADEYDGLDLAEHDINAYPDFQQTMIKSYHLREA